MSVIRFRPVLLGSPETPDLVFPLWEEEDGTAVLWDDHSAWPLDARLDSVAPRHLPRAYRDPRLRVTILPVQEATGATRAEAFDALLEYCRGLGKRELASVR